MCTSTSKVYFVRWSPVIFAVSLQVCRQQATSAGKKEQGRTRIPTITSINTFE
jgi:hypothetical protein